MPYEPVEPLTVHSASRMSFDGSTPPKEDTMAVQIVMDHTGDTRHHFDPADARAIAEAEARFMQLTSAGFTAAKRLGEGKSQVLKSFDPTAEETLFIPRLQGG